jgi:hypothetical protein
MTIAISCPGRAQRRPGLVLLGAVLAVAACGATRAADVSVTIEGDTYRWAGYRFENLAAVEAAVMPRSPQTLRLEACGVGAVETLKAAAYRFRHLALELWMAESGAAGCAGPMVASLAGFAPTADTPPDADFRAAERWWQQTMP